VFFLSFRQFGPPFLGALPRIPAQWQFLQRIQKTPATHFIPI
jgi:hypothetical protein